MTDTGREWISRRQFLDMLGISDSNERRQRREGHPWPPHLRIGNKVYYRRSAVEDWLRRQEAICNSTPPEVGAKPIDNAATATTRPRVNVNLVDGVPEGNNGA